jgi:hypothetical protein
LGCVDELSWSVGQAHQLTDGPVPVDILSSLFQGTHRFGQGLPGLGGFAGSALYVDRGVGGRGHAA